MLQSNTTWAISFIGMSGWGEIKSYVIASLSWIKIRFFFGDINKLGKYLLIF